MASPRRGGSAAIAIVEVRGDVDHVLHRLIGESLAIGAVRLRTVPDVDHLVVARTGEHEALLFPHAGAAILNRVTGALERAGANELDAPSRETDHFDPASLDAALHDALVEAASPLAIDLLLQQPARWARARDARGNDAQSVLPDDAASALHRLIDPPLVVAIGPPNVGKSSLLNALAGRGVSMVADEPGTTRDHVGALIELAGLTVRFIDAPGIDRARVRDDPIQAESQRLAMNVAEAADLVLWCGDAASSFLPTTMAPKPLLRVALRADLGLPTEPVDVVVSVDRNPVSVEALVGAIREHLVPARWLTDDRAWRFWEAPVMRG